MLPARWLSGILLLAALMISAHGPVESAQRKSRSKPSKSTKSQAAKSSKPAPPKSGTQRSEPAPDSLATQVDPLVASDPDRWSIRVVDLETNRVLYEHNPNGLLLPASNEKALTTAVALSKLGPNWTTKTSVYATSKPDSDGVVDGDLVLYGRGDPNLSDRFSKSGDPLFPLRQLVEQLEQQGVTEIDGDIVADESYLTGPPHGSGWGWTDLQWHFGAEVSALSFNDNLVEIQVLPGDAPGLPGVVRVVPDIDYIEIVNSTQTVAAGSSRVAVHRSLDSSRVEVSGTLSRRSSGWIGEVAIHDPALFTAAAFRRALTDAGITVSGETRRIGAYMQRPDELDLGDLVELASLESHPLSDLIHVVNKHSQNLHAEILLRQLGHAFPSDGESDDVAGVSAIIAYLSEVGVDTDGISIFDGSGLSRLNRVRASTLQGCMSAMSRNPYEQVFVDSLPQAGVDGTLKNRLRGLDVRAKTGSLTAAKSLSGYLRTRRGAHVSFSIIYNDPKGTGGAIPRIDRIASTIAASG